MRTIFVSNFMNHHQLPFSASLEVEGQKPDGIIEYEEYGRTMYMWYYNDLKSNKRGDCLSYSVDVPE